MKNGNGFEETAGMGEQVVWRVDFMHDRRTLLMIHLAEVLVFVVMTIAAFSGIREGKGMEVLTLPFWPYFGWMIALILLLLVYQLLHVMTHGLILGIGRKEKIRFGFAHLYLYACGAGNYSRRHYLWMLVCPLLLWGVVFGALGCILIPLYAPMAYLLQMANIMTSIKDLWVAGHILWQEDDVRIVDDGLNVTVFGKRSDFPD